MTTQGPVPGLDKLLRDARLDFEHRVWQRISTKQNYEYFAQRADESFAALITAIEAPWREALRSAYDALGKNEEWQEEPREQIRALLHSDAEVNDD